MHYRLNTRVGLGLALLLGLASPISKAETIVIAADEWCPYTCDDQKRPGIAIELAQKIYEPHGISVKYVFHDDWGEILERVASGEYDAAAGAVPAEVPHLRLPKHRFSTQSACFFMHPRSNWSYRGLDTLESVSIGMVESYSFTKKLDQYLLSNMGSEKVRGYVNGKQLTAAFNRGEFDAMLENSKVVSYRELQGEFKFQIRRTGCQTLPSTMDSLYFAFSPTSSARMDRLIRIMSEGQQKANENGSTLSVHQRYSIRNQ